MSRALLALAAALAAAGCGSSKTDSAGQGQTSSTPASKATEQSVCLSEQQAGVVTVFGHRRTRRAAAALQARAETHGFRGLRVVQDSCGDWEVDLYGLKTPAQRRELAREARQVGFRVVFELG